MVISAAIGGGISTIITVIKKLYEDHEIDLDKIIVTLRNDLDKEKLGRDLSEKNIMLNSAIYNEAWIKSNVSIEGLEKMLAELKTTKQAASK
jgi:hypothetical protein